MLGHSARDRCWNAVFVRNIFGCFLLLHELGKNWLKVLPINHYMIIGNGVWVFPSRVYLHDSVVLVFLFVRDNLVVFGEDFHELLFGVLLCPLAAQFLIIKVIQTLSNRSSTESLLGFPWLYSPLDFLTSEKSDWALIWIFGF